MAAGPAPLEVLVLLADREPPVVPALREAPGVLPTKGLLIQGIPGSQATIRMAIRRNPWREAALSPVRPEPCWEKRDRKPSCLCARAEIHGSPKG